MPRCLNLKLGNTVRRGFPFSPKKDALYTVSLLQFLQIAQSNQLTVNHQQYQGGRHFPVSQRTGKKLQRKQSKVTFDSLNITIRPATRGGQSGNCRPEIFTNVCIC